MTLVTSRRRQHELLRSWSTWAMTSILLDPAAVALVRETGWSGTHHADPSTGERIAGTAQGLGFGVSDSWHHPREVIAWPDIEAIAKEVPTEVRERLGEFQETLREHRRTYPRFAASADAIGCGPIVEGQPLTPRQEAHVREAFDARGVLQAWEKKYADLDAGRLELHERALAAVLDQEPVDLLELLEDQHLNQPAPRDAVEQARQTRAPDDTTSTGSHGKEAPIRIRNYTDHQRQTAHPRSSAPTTEPPIQEPPPIGEGRERISVAELRRSLPAGARVLLTDEDPRVQEASARNSGAAERSATPQRPALLPPAPSARQVEPLRTAPATGVAR